MKIAVLIDNDMIQRFALDSLNAVEDTDGVAIFSCTNTRFSRKWLRHGVYYALNLLAVRNRLTRLVSIASTSKKIINCTTFDAEYEGAWQRLPATIVSALAAGGFDVILKFGMGLLRVPPHSELPTPILSYHHGDPDRYRGRPAGFWEIADGTPAIGQIVQVISNCLDAGRVVAFAETKVKPWSYRATLMESFRHSPLIINTAIRNAVAGRSLEKHSQGRNCRLPSNAQATVFIMRTAARYLRRLAYGAFVEKRWNVSTAPVRALQLARVFRGEMFPPKASWRDVPIARDYLFYADPFFTSDPAGLLVEALDRRSGLGRLLFIEGDNQHSAASAAGHMSYPSTSRIEGREIILPETGSWSPPFVCALHDGRLERERMLRIDNSARITDGTLYEHHGRVYLFGNLHGCGSTALYLWSADSLDGEFLLHPCSPVRISPKGGRMGGAVANVGNRLIRLGQDLSGQYGDGLLAFEILALTESTYEERLLGRIAFTDRRGPHTLNIRGDEIVFDWYIERPSITAGVRRLAAWRSAVANRRRGG